MQPEIDYREKPSPEMRRCWWLLSLLLWLILSPAYSFLIAPLIDASRTVFMPTGLWVPAAMLLPSFGLGLLITIILHRTASLTRVLRPTRARVMGAFGLWLVMPVSAVGIFPFSAGYVAIMALRTAGLAVSGNAALAVVSTALLGASYLIACLLSHGLPQLGKRLLAYALIWGACASIVIAAGHMRIFMV